MKAIEDENKRDALIKFFVGFVKQTSKPCISKMSFLTNAVNAYLYNKYEMHLFIKYSSYLLNDDREDKY